MKILNQNSSKLIHVNKIQNKVDPKSYYYYQFSSFLRKENIKLKVLFMWKYTVEKTVRLSFLEASSLSSQQPQLKGNLNEVHPDQKL